MVYIISENSITKRRNVLVLVFITLFSLNSSAQIQRKFYDFTFGLTQKSQVYNYFKAKGHRIRIIDENTIAVNNVKFGGFDWGVSYFSFYKNKFYQVNFMSSENDMIKESLDDQWELLDSKIMAKYSKYIVKNMSSDKEKYYFDSKTVTKLVYELFQGSWVLSIIYYDDKLFNLKSSSEDSEL